jgi:hypothetical protein
MKTSVRTQADRSGRGETWSHWIVRTAAVVSGLVGGLTLIGILVAL